MRRPALIFDFGNVVAHFDYRRAASTLGSRINLSGEDLLDRLRPLGFSDLLKTFESGKITAEEFSRGVSEMVGLAIDHDDFVAAWADIFSANESIAPLLASLKGAGYTLILGSNTNDLHANHFRRQFAETLAHFDRLVLSYEVGHIKPSSAFYLACADAAEAEPGDCVFIDDLPENIEGARAAGLVGILYRETDALVRDLEKLGVMVRLDT
ncbi:HAD family hydrolase [Tundrisphaera lichenicola]|uniref:HAD family hydrolase n=1 Tax=Tundrisphaera lichenicola TaxID=2029860 RepID=UPI003EB77626